MARLSIEAVAEKAGIAEGTVKRAEKTEGSAPVTNANAKLIMAALEAAGVVFLPAGEFGPGVCQRLSLPEPEAGGSFADRAPLVREGD